MIVLLFGTSFIQNIGNQTQKIPPITSVKDNKVNSAAGITLDPIEYKIKPKQTNVPWVANNAWFFPDDKKFKSFVIIITAEIIAQNKPAIATVVNFGVSFFHLSVTENIAKPVADNKPNIKPKIEVFWIFPPAIIAIPTVAIKIAIQTFNEIFSFRNKKPKSAAIKGIAAKQRSVIAALVCVIDQIKDIMAEPSPKPPSKVGKPPFI